MNRTSRAGHRSGERTESPRARRALLGRSTARCALMVSVLAGLMPACNRGFYRRTADRDAYAIAFQKGQGPTWNLPAEYTVEPDPRSRFSDPTPGTDPMLPMPAPQLYNYTLPPLATPAPQERELQSNTQALPPDEYSRARDQAAERERQGGAGANAIPSTAPDTLPSESLPPPVGPSAPITPEPAEQSQRSATAAVVQTAAFDPAAPPESDAEEVEAPKLALDACQ